MEDILLIVLLLIQGLFAAFWTLVCFGGIGAVIALTIRAVSAHNNKLTFNPQIASPPPAPIQPLPLPRKHLQGRNDPKRRYYDVKGKVELSCPVPIDVLQQYLLETLWSKEVPASLFRDNIITFKVPFMNDSPWRKAYPLPQLAFGVFKLEQKDANHCIIHYKLARQPDPRLMFFLMCIITAIPILAAYFTGILQLFINAVLADSNSELLFLFIPVGILFGIGFHFLGRTLRPMVMASFLSSSVQKATLRYSARAEASSER